MIWSATKKKIEDTATIMNTMIVVIMVSRRVGQVTLAVSERTSCRNLNGLKAIVGVRIRSAGNVVSRRDFSYFRNPDSPLVRPTLFRRMSRQAGSIVRGFQCRAGYPSKRADSRCRYLLWDGLQVKVRILGQKLAGAAGLEPSTLGFGDRCSTN